ncbi:Biopolymer transport protein ExbD/TolR [Denitrovibrio acetiphilus DSM 12809]|uniref:Biopolymer transport protein ExbD/TolR n=1 Tax=Denitrovibrio acetiphilus (strain DSM 12809 / NBRC 114555 / N2460) TaxID=522772 RepID=D4H776_DENA2|nr:biopolymer transporter ExbD [Denitrovibrio acetiphilus]ADD67875.1 Biopolymer transport protein ExbD/TolR [Denitrovibrio acetiphilus DSM 12809]
MKFSKKGDNNNNIEVNLTPLIDVVFLLLIFFMVSTTFIYSNSIDVNLPAAKGDETSVSENIRVVLTQSGVINIDGKAYPENAVEKHLAQMKKSKPESTVIIEADKNVTHGRVVFVMDASRKAGFDKFAIAVEEE